MKCDLIGYEHKGDGRTILRFRTRPGRIQRLFGAVPEDIAFIGPVPWLTYPGFWAVDADMQLWLYRYLYRVRGREKEGLPV